MPYVRKTKKPGRDTKKLVDGLVKELKSPRSVGQPIILEDRTPETKSIRVHVAWDDWHDCSRESRERVIREAYDRSELVAPGEQITLAVGVTVPEAAAIGLLPFEIRRRRGISKRETGPESRAAMIETGASTLFAGGQPVLRCATEEDAEAAVELLKSKLPGSKWMVIREVERGDE